MRILVLTDGFPWPLTSGRLREYHFIRELSRRHAIVLLSAVPPGQPQEHLRELEPFVERVETIETARLATGLASKVRGRLNAFVRSGETNPMRTLVERAAWLHAAEPFDVVLNAHLDAPIRKRLGDLPIVVDLCDAIASGAAARLRYAPPRELPRAAVRSLEARRKERRLVKMADRMLLATDRDVAKVFADGMPAVPRVSVVPNGVDLGYWRRSATGLGAAVVMTGAMPYAPNHDAALRLVGRIMPRVWEQWPDARLLIIGRDPRPELIRAGRVTDRVTVTGAVDDVRPGLETASVFAAPLRFATGIQNKVLEAMAMEVPVIASPVAAAGLVVGGIRPPIEVAATDETFADAIVRRLDAARADPSPDAEARAWVAERFDWARIGEWLETLLVEVSATGR